MALNVRDTYPCKKKNNRARSITRKASTHFRAQVTSVEREKRVHRVRVGTLVTHSPTFSVVPNPNPSFVKTLCLCPFELLYDLELQNHKIQ